MKYFFKKLSINAKFAMPLITGAWWFGTHAEAIWHVILSIL